MTQEKKKTIVEHLAEVMSEVRAVEKAHEMKLTGNRSYKYRSIEDVMAAYHAAMERHGIIVAVTDFYPTVRGTFSREYADGSKVTYPVVDATFTLTFCRGEDGKHEQLSTQAWGSAIADDDKYAGKIISYGLKYALTVLTLCPYSDMPDTDKTAGPENIGKPTVVEQREEPSGLLDKGTIDKVLAAMNAFGVTEAELVRKHGPVTKWNKETLEAMRSEIKQLRAGARS